MIEGPLLLVVILLAVVLIVVGASVFKVHPFIMLLIASLLVGIVVGIPAIKVVGFINDGFGSIIGGIGIVIILGSILGVILEKSGAAIKIAEFILQTIGRKSPELGIGFLGALVSIPVFCDSGFIILSRLCHVMAKKRNVAAGSLFLSLAGGMYTTHTLVPPTPGPIAAAGNLGGESYLGLVIISGLLISIPVVLIAVAYSKYIFKKYPYGAELTDSPIISDQYLPSLGLSMSPIFVPLILIGLGSVAQFVGFQNTLIDALVFLGNPVIALLAGLLIAVPLLKYIGKAERSSSFQEGLVQAGPVLILTGAGAAFGAVLKATPMAQMVEGWLSGGDAGGIYFILAGFVFTAILKTSQGSTTSAMVITSSILGPLLPLGGLDNPTGIVLMVAAIGGGGMTVSHANDSFFWVVAQFSGIRDIKVAYRTITLMSLLQGCTILFITILAFLVLL
ncbi:MAG: GntP family permease [Imperialibacter sp.]|uniref:GntP family permease n=1 Tax=Imperialibacter sp. TaxID=2038411 RepID=UPI0032EEE972